MTLPTVAVLKGDLVVDVSSPTATVPDQTVRLVVPGVDGHTTGAFSIDFSDYPDGPVPEETGLRDNFLDDPDNEDEMGIRDGKLAVVDFRGPDQAFSTAEAGGGRRGFLYRNTVTLTTNVSGAVEVPLSGAAGNVGGAPLLHVNNDFEGAQYVGISCWFVPAPFNWTELGVVGRLQEDFAYLDLHPSTSMPVPGDDIFLRSVGGFVSLEVNGETICGPCEIPVGLAGSAIHGVQMDVAADVDEGAGMTEGLVITSDSTPLGTRTAPATPAFGTPVETASSTTINVPYPAGISAGNSLYCIVGTKNGGTVSASGWTTVPSDFGITLGPGIRVLRKTAVGSEAGSLTVTKSTAGIMSAAMVRVTGDQSATVLNGQANSVASTSITAPAIPILGPKRTLLWIAVNNLDSTITPPAGWFTVSALDGAQAMRLLIAVAVIDTHPDFPDPPIFNAYAATHFPAQVGTCASTTSAAGTLVLHPAKGT